MVLQSKGNLLQQIYDLEEWITKYVYHIPGRLLMRGSWIAVAWTSPNCQLSVLQCRRWKLKIHRKRRNQSYGNNVMWILMPAVQLHNVCIIFRYKYHKFRGSNLLNMGINKHAYRRCIWLYATWYNLTCTMFAIITKEILCNCSSTFVWDLFYC